MTLIIQQPIFSSSKSAESTPRHRSRPKSLFFRQDTLSPTCSEPTSPKVNCAGRVRERAAIKASTESKGEKKITLVRSLTSSLRGSVLIDGAIRCCRSPRDLVTGESDDEREKEKEEEGEGVEGRYDLARCFMMAEFAGKECMKGTMDETKVGEGLILAPPPNALQLMKQRSASARAAQGEGKGEADGDRKRNSF